MGSERNDLASYRYGSVPNTEENIAHVREAFARILEDFGESEATGEMVVPFAQVIHFVLRNRFIRHELSETPWLTRDAIPRSSGTGPRG